MRSNQIFNQKYYNRPTDFPSKNRNIIVVSENKIVLTNYSDKKIISESDAGGTSSHDLILDFNSLIR